MKKALRISVSKQSSIIRLIKRILYVIFLFDIGLLKMQAQTVTDIEGNVYNTVTIGTQVWMAENLKTTKYNDNTTIPPVTESAEWVLLSTPGYCWYNNDAATYKDTYGALYNWYTASSGKLCPSGWHVPTFNEWRTLIIPYIIGSASFCGSELMSTDLWSYYVGTNETGFSAVPGGMRYSDGTFAEIGENCNYWSSEGYGLSTKGWYQPIPFPPTCSLMPSWILQEETSGLSIRCLKDDLSTNITNPSVSVIQIYPNPVSGILNIEYKGENFETVSILNLKGVLLTKEKAITPRQQIDFSKYTSGLYFLVFVKTSGEIKIVKVVHN